jgi:manganese oxidase
MSNIRVSRVPRGWWWLALALALATWLGTPGTASAQSCARLLQADVVALDQVFFWNRLGAVQPQGMMFALRRDVVSTSGGTTLSAGNVQLRPGKRPRPLVLRMNVGDCLQINFQNLLANAPVDQEQPATRWASVHVVGMQLKSSITDDGSNVGANPSSLVPPGGQAIYTLYADKEGEHVLWSTGATTGGEGDGGQLNSGLFGALIVEPAGARWYRSQVSRADLDLATTGLTQYGQPILNYEARFPTGHPQAGQLILGMLDGTTVVKTDLTAMIVGPQADGRFPAGSFPANAAYPNREQPFREFTIIYHDEIGAVQAFPQFEDEVLHHTLQSGRDGFAINYGTGGVGAEVLANRLGVGPVAGCTECKYEEFFLSSWALGDPAMVVDVPANAPCTVANIRDTANPPVGVMGCTPTPGPKATKAFYPDDPSNVYHSYLKDHVRFRVLHGGSKEHHIHHLHAHQWEFSADSDKSAYLDSQALGPGASFTGEIAHEGSGNTNLTVGDSIFHCHFYPHFAQGMWSLWRTHDVFERGTVLGADGRPAPGSRALPDGEIAAGTPIPALVPLPGKPMAPMPGATVSIVGGQAQIAAIGGVLGNPGYPFFVPGVAGHRPPHPPLDTIDDGGLARHVITGGTFTESHTRLDFDKTLVTAVATPVAETGTAIEQVAMAYHALPTHPSCLPSGTCATTTVFLTNGRPAVAGAPYADPCVNAAGQAIPVNRRYKAADIQTDVKLNKEGWHSPQQRFSSLWQDVASYLAPNGSTAKPPEPLFFRANTGDCIEYQLTNLVPNKYQLDDFQVRTPTDILGQHIHLVKFDVTSSDGAGNGWNYEDGTFSPDEVVERIKAIRKQNGCDAGGNNPPPNGTFQCPVAKPHPFFGAGPNGAYLGAQTTVQRWYADPVLDNQGNDRTLRTVFTHDHFGPSTHQQTGLYAGLVVEPTGSTWVHNETGVPFYTRADGGPTSWQAVIDPGAGRDYREFMLEFADYQLAYTKESTTFPDPAHVINPPVRDDVGLPKLLEKAAICPGGAPLPCPEAISAADVGTMAVNYRNEPVALRVRTATNTQADLQAGDLAYAFSSNVTRADTALNVQPGFYAPLTTNVQPKDPYTPLLRSYENDRVQIRILVGAHEEGHNFSVHGIKWLFEPSDPNSGWRNSQMMGISEHFEFIVPQLIKNPTGASVDRLWSAGSATDDYWNGIWGLLRSYTGTRQDLVALPSNPNGRSGIDPGTLGAWDFSCPKNAPVRALDVTAVYGNKALRGPYLAYNARTDGAFGPLYDPYSILYVRTSDLNATGKLLAGVPNEPLVLRARAGECIQLTLRNGFSGNRVELDGYNTLPMIVEGFNANEIKPSNEVGLHPQLLYYDVSRYDGANVGGNATQTIGLNGAAKTYQWYAGDVRINPDGSITATPVEFGATNLISADRIEHASKGAFGALIIEPADATWIEDTTSRAAATVTSASAGSFREMVLMFQTDANLLQPDPTTNGSGAPVKNLFAADDAEDTGQKAINYRTEPMWKRLQYPPETPLTTTRTFDFHNALSNSQVGADPQTPVVTAHAGQAVRIRVLQAGGHARNGVFSVFGHLWDKEPYTNGSTTLGTNPLSPGEGARMGLGPTNHFDVLLRNGAGGAFSVTGDYLFRDMVGLGLDGGLWGILRVIP